MSAPKEALYASGVPHMCKWTIWWNMKIIVEAEQKNVKNVESSSCSKTLKRIFKQTVLRNLPGKGSPLLLVLLLTILHTHLQLNLAQLQV